MDLYEYAAFELADLIRSRELRATEVLEQFAARIEALNGELNAFYFTDLDSARAAAAGVDADIARGGDPGLFAGVPMGIKELEDVADWPAEHASLILQGRVAEADSTQVRRLRDAGAVLVGKTCAPEFGSIPFTRSKLHGVTRNPWNRERTPGGSSGGSAAAVAAGLVPIASASDGGGSTRIPASYTGLYGLKPTFGRIPTGPGVASITNTGVLGCLTTSVRDAARWLDAVAGPSGTDVLSLPPAGRSYERDLDSVDVAGLRAAWSSDLGYAAVDGAVRTVAQEAGMALVEAAGLELVDEPVEFRDAGPAWGVLGAVDIVREVGQAYPDRLDECTPTIRMALEFGMNASVSELGRAQEARNDLIERVAALFERIDVLLTPATATVAFAAAGPIPTEIDGRTVPPMRSVALTYPFNMTGNAAASVPAGFSPEGLPVGLQIVCRRFEEDRVLKLSRVLEQAHGWPRLAPMSEEVARA